MARSWPLLALLALALATRILFAAEFVSRDLGFEQDPTRDMHHYFVGGQGVRQGDLTLEGTYPCYQYFIDKYGDDLFRRLHGERPLTNAPLYFFAIGATQLVTDSPHLMRALQMGLNLASCVLVFLLAQQITGRRRLALVAMVLFMLHGTSVFYAAYLLRATVITFLLLLFVLAVVWTLKRPGHGPAGALGASLGLLHLTKTTLPLCAPVALLALLLAPAGRSRRVGLALTTLAAFLAINAPLIARNLACGCAPLHNESFADYNIISFNHPGADGLHFNLPPDPLYREVVLASEGSRVRTLLKTISCHPDPLGWPRLMVAKLRGFWSGYEAWNNVDVHVGERVLRTFPLFPVSSALLLPLGLVGLVLSLRQAKARWPLFAGLGVVLASCLASAALARYRLPAAPFLAVFGAIALVELTQAVKAPRRLALLLGAFLVAGLLAWPVASTERPPHRVERYLGGVRQRIGETERAKEHALRAALLHPLATSPPQELRALPQTPEWREFAALNRWAWDLCQETGDAAGAQRIHANLARHVRSGD
jgi:4-amino-4-deoxy-L-arabinose transferase-like glycosyltransferase